MSTVTWSELLIATYYAIVIVLSVRIILQKRNPVKTYAYIILLLAVPLLGLLIYFFFGTDYRRVKFYKRKRYFDLNTIKRWNDQITPVMELMQNNHLAESLQFKKLSKLLLESNKSIITLKNKVKLLVNGENYYPVLFERMDAAKHHIHIDMYEITSDELGEIFIQKCIDAVNRGVLVRLIYDSVGCIGLTNADIDRMKDHGVQIFPFTKVRFPEFGSRANNRTHCKVVIIDGNEYFNGGINIDQRYDNSRNERYWFDTMLHVKGDATIPVQNHFLLKWEFVSDETLDTPSEYMPENDINDDCPIQYMYTGPDSDWESILLTFNVATQTAQDYIYFMTPYFAPEDSLLNALVIAAQSGCDVRLIIPEDSDSKLVDYASKSYVTPLLLAGVKIYFYEKGMMHAKNFVVDDFCTYIGTANMDVRSFYFNFECGSLVYDSDLAQELKQQFLNECENSCYQVKLEDWKQRGTPQRVAESICRLFSPII